MITDKILKSLQVRLYQLQESLFKTAGKEERFTVARERVSPWINILWT
jgi:hypothetical protein